MSDKDVIQGANATASEGAVQGSNATASEGVNAEPAKTKPVRKRKSKSRK